MLLICVLLFNTTHSQSKYGNDSLACMESRAIYNMHYKQKNYDLQFLLGERLLIFVQHHQKIFLSMDQR